MPPICRCQKKKWDAAHRHLQSAMIFEMGNTRLQELLKELNEKRQAAANGILNHDFRRSQTTTYLALDYPYVQEAIAMIHKVRPAVTHYKVEARVVFCDG